MVLTKSEQFLLLEFLGKKYLTKQNQKIYLSIKFHDAIRKLKKNNLVKSHRYKNGRTIYYLTLKGKARANLIGMDANTPKITKQFVVEEIIILGV